MNEKCTKCAECLEIEEKDGRFFCVNCDEEYFPLGAGAKYRKDLQEEWIRAGIIVVFKRGIHRGMVSAGNPDMDLNDVPLEVLIDLGKNQYEKEVKAALEEWQEAADDRILNGEDDQVSTGRMMNMQCRSVRMILNGWAE